MQRRHFLRTGLALPFLPPVVRTAKRRVIPPRLRAGDTVGLITPGSFLSDEGVEKAVRQLERLGLRVKKGQYLRAQRGFTAGTDAERLADLHAMFADPEVKAIWCGRGGYGCGRLLPRLDFKLIKRHPKILIGYSDITALLIAITEHTGLVTYHGPVGSTDFTDYNLRHLRAALLAGETYQPILRPATYPDEGVYEAYTLRSGVATGTLWGGNLSLLAAAAGTGYTPPLKDTLLFIEEIGEKPYRIDRMLTQLRQSWDLERSAGILLGIFRGCEADPDDLSLSLRQTLTDRLDDLGVPVAYGFPIGHIQDMCTLPVGLSARADMDRLRITIHEEVG